ncbi:hypothetical protein ACTU45_32870 [Streptomyces sp. 24-1644]|uniref:hypothetical protein n=1 Tax=Streptomyces sp. 24-1644 TaxID=3457315 RepID=UPI003FA7EB2F
MAPALHVHRETPGQAAAVVPPPRRAGMVAVSAWVLWGLGDQVRARRISSSVTSSVMAVTPMSTGRTKRR